MITTKRSGNVVSESYASNGSVGLLERETPVSYTEFKKEEVSQEINMDEARERMQSNLQKLLNYDRYSQEVAEEAKTEVPAVEEVKVQAVATTTEDDIRPTSTTMQFGDGDLDQMYKEMNAKAIDNSESYKLNGKGKLAVVLYSLVVAVIMALIVLNTGVLTRLHATNDAKQSELNALMSEYSTQQQLLEDVSDNGYVIDAAKDLGMIKG
ncbi:MAG: hypothetical protein E7369_04720 [Clostridiales bacterium]|nr:hypothetical protein [Clostridiales bacterium]